MTDHVSSTVPDRSEDGASAVEYGLLISGIAALIIVMVFLFGGAVQNMFSSSCGKLSSGVATSSVSSTATC